MKMVKARPGGDSSRHHLRQFGGCTNRTGLHKGSRYAARVALFPKTVNKISQVTLRTVIHNRFCRRFALRVHAHIERAWQTETESSRGILKLHRAQAEIGHYAIRGRQAARRVQRIDLREVAVHRDQPLPEGSQALAREGQGCGVAVDPQEPSPALLEYVEDSVGMPTCTERRVDIEAIGSYIQKLQSFPK
jgi:hypothetical protein